MRTARLRSTPAVLVLAALAGLGACRPSTPPAPSASTAPAGEGLVILNPSETRDFFHDFGERVFGEKVAHTYRVENREGRDLHVQDLLPTCSCTVPTAAYVTPSGERVEAPRRTQGIDFTVPAGAVLEVTITLDTSRVERPNQHKLTQVRMRSDSASRPYLTFELHVLAKRTFRAAPAEVALVDVPQSAGKSGRTDVTTEVREDGSRVRGVVAVEGPFEAAIEERQVGGEAVWVLTVTAAPGLALGPHQGKVVLGTTRPDGTGEGQAFEVPVRAQVVEDCVLNPRVLVFPDQAARRVEAELVALAPGARVGVRRAEVVGAPGGAFRVESTAVDPDDAGRAQRWSVTVELAQPDLLPAGGLAAKLRVETDDAAAPTVEAPLSVPPR